jgi:N-acylneuraminate cytidylyltransferase
MFAGKPLYHSVLSEILKSRYDVKIFIDTDSDNIINDVRENFCDVKIINRPNELLGDYVSMNKIIEHDLSQIEGNIFVQTHSTNPLLKIETIDSAIEFFINNRDKYDSVFSVTKWQTRFYWNDGKPVNHNPKELLRTQDLPPIYEENSNFYIFTKESFINANGKRIGLKPYMFEMDPMEAIDIDTDFSFRLAENIDKTLKGIQ